MKKPFGRPLKTPQLGHRVPVCVKLPTVIADRLRSLAKRREMSQSDIITNLLLKEK
jgi:hypothetical protein